MSYWLENVEERQKRCPGAKQFKIPSSEARNNIDAGTRVRLVFFAKLGKGSGSQGQELSVETQSYNNENNMYVGILVEEPLLKAIKVKVGDAIVFRAEHVAGIEIE